MRYFYTSLLLFSLAAPLSAQRQYLGSEALTVDDTTNGVGFSSNKISPPGPSATTAVCRLETAQIRFQIDGKTAVTSSAGTLWEIGEERQFNGQDVLRNFRAIRTGSTSGTLQCNYSNP